MDPSSSKIEVSRRKSEFRVLVDGVRTVERIVDSYKTSDNSLVVEIKA